MEKNIHPQVHQNNDNDPDTLTIDEAIAKDIPPQIEKELESLRETVRQYETHRPYHLSIPTDENTIRFGVISDIHAGSWYCRYDALHEFIKYMKAQKIFTLLIVGDILDGHGMYKGQEFEQEFHGVKKQINVLKERFPSTKDMNVYMITGNHDFSFDKLVGMGIGETIANEMGWTYLGQDHGDLTLFNKVHKPYKIHLMHPSGGTAYAVSYRSQKIVEQIPGGKKPNMMLIGHFHKADWMPTYRNVSTFQVGAFQSQTPYMAQKPTDSHVGGFIMEVTLPNTNSLCYSIRPEFIPFFEPEEQ